MYKRQGSTYPTSTTSQTAPPSQVPPQSGGYGPSPPQQTHPVTTQTYPPGQGQPYPQGYPQQGYGGQSYPPAPGQGPAGYQYPRPPGPQGGPTPPAQQNQYPAYNYQPNPQ